MHSTPLLTRFASITGGAALLLVTMAPTLAITALPQEATSQDDRSFDDEPYNEDEWYDPTDWFDGNNYEWDDKYIYEAHDNWNEDFYWNGDRDVGHQQWRYSPYTYDWYDRYRYDFEYDPTYLDGWWRDTENSEGSSQANKQGDQWRWDAEAGKWQRTQTQGSTGSSRQGSRTAGRAEGSLAGTVESFNRIRLDDQQGQQRHHTLVKVRLQDGTRRLVDLGPDVSIDALEVAEGDQVKIEGRRGTLADRDVLRARSMHVEGERVDLASNANDNRDDRSRKQGGANQSQEERNTKRQGMAQNVSFRGELEGFREVPSEDGRYSQLLVRLHMDDGTKRVVDFGRSKDLADLNLSKGSEVVVHGHQVTKNGRTILQATRYSVDGERQGSQRTSAGAQQGSGNSQTANRSQTNRSQDKTSNAKRQTAWTSGFVDSIREISLPGARGTSTYARIRIDDDTTKILDLGPRLEFDKLECEPGDYMMVRGAERTLNGRKVLVVRELRINAAHRDVKQEDWQTSSEAVEAPAPSNPSSGAGSSK